MTFRCNLPDSPTVNLTVQSQFGALQREGGTERVNYALQWNVAGGGTAVDAQNLVSSVGFALAAGDIVAGQGGMLRVIVNGTGPLPAGTYRDRITYTISP